MKCYFLITLFQKHSTSRPYRSQYRQLSIIQKDTQRVDLMMVSVLFFYTLKCNYKHFLNKKGYC